MIVELEMTHDQYMACHKDYRRAIRGRKELLVMDRETGKPSWVPVRIVSKTTGQRQVVDGTN